MFDVRAQLWQTVEFVEDAQANDKLAARGLLLMPVCRWYRLLTTPDIFGRNGVF